MLFLLLLSIDLKMKAIFSLSQKEQVARLFKINPIKKTPIEINTFSFKNSIYGWRSYKLIKGMKIKFSEVTGLGENSVKAVVSSNNGAMISFLLS